MTIEATPSAPAAAPAEAPATPTPAAAPSPSSPAAAGVEHLETQRPPAVRSSQDRIARAASKLSDLAITPPNAEPVEAAAEETAEPETPAEATPTDAAERQARVAETVAARREAQQHATARAQAESALEAERKAHAETRSQLESRGKHVDPSTLAARWVTDPLGMLEEIGADVLTGYQKLTAHAANPQQRELERLRARVEKGETEAQKRERESAEANEKRQAQEREAAEQQAFKGLFDRVVAATGDVAKFPFLAEVEASDRFKRIDDLAREKNTRGEEWTEEGLYAEIEAAERGRFERRAKALGFAAAPPAAAATPAAPKPKAKPTSIGADMAGQSAGRSVTRTRDERIAAAARAMPDSN